MTHKTDLIDEEHGNGFGQSKTPKTNLVIKKL